MTTFNSRLPKLQATTLPLDRSGAKPLSKIIATKQTHAQSLFGFDKSNIIDYVCKPLDYSNGFETPEVQRFYVFYKKASRDKVLKVSVTPFQKMSNYSTEYGRLYGLYVDIGELTTYTSVSDLKWGSLITGGTSWFKSDVDTDTRFVVPPNGAVHPIPIQDSLDVSTWTTNNIYCFEIKVYSYDIAQAGAPHPHILGLGKIHISVNPEDSGIYQDETAISNGNLLIGKEILTTRTDTGLKSGIVQVVGEIDKVKNSSFDHTQALFQDLAGPGVATYEEGFETHLVPDENLSFGTPSTIPLLTLNTPRFQKGYSGGDKVFQFCMKYVASTTEPVNHTFELEYRVRWKDSEAIIQNWASLQIFNVPDNASIFTGDFNLPASAAGYPLNRCIVDFRILTSDTSYPFKVQTIAIIEKQYT